TTPSMGLHQSSLLLWISVCSFLKKSQLPFALYFIFSPHLPFACFYRKYLYGTPFAMISKYRWSN
uniref:Uncharacterized protein n=1 Tax=Gopherus evgoodei TaxID=1825980 RepID=A0A8C4YTT7_9SAUR